MSKPTYLFYEVMNYPIPFNKEFFAYEKVLTTIKKPGEVSFSRAKMCPSMEVFVGHVNKLGWLWKSCPFVEAIYIGNSMSFNSLQDDSDIDLFIVVSPGRMRLARIWSNTVLLFLGLRRRRSYTYKKFNLNFYVERDKLNLQRIKYDHGDPYLVYWLAHLVPIYQRLEHHQVDIYEQNYRLREYLPNFPMEQVIQLGTHVHTGSTQIKRVVERMFGGWVGDMLQWLIKCMMLPFLVRRKKRLGALGESIIISDHMLKFHKDKRKEYAMKWKIAKKR